MNYGCSLSTGRSVVGNPNRHWYRVVSFFKILKNDKRAIKLASSLCIIWCCFSLCIYRRKISRPGKILVSVWYGETFISFLWPSVGKYDKFLVIFVWNIKHLILVNFILTLDNNLIAWDVLSRYWRNIYPLF